MAILTSHVQGIYRDSPTGTFPPHFHADFPLGWIYIHFQFNCWCWYIGPAKSIQWSWLTDLSCSCCDVGIPKVQYVPLIFLNNILFPQSIFLYSENVSESMSAIEPATWSLVQIACESGEFPSGTLPEYNELDECSIYLH